jgi:F-type H+-transporting ATPase subunit b
MELVKPDFGLFFWMVLSFTILLFLLKKFAWKPILESLKERETSIEKALKAAEEAKKEVENIKSENDKILKEALLERDKILKEAHDTKNKIIEEAKGQAKEEAAKILQNAREEIEHEKNMMLAEMKNLVVDISVTIAEKVLSKQLDDKQQQEKYISDLFDKEINLN